MRILTLIEFVVRRSLQESGESLRGIYPLVLPNVFEIIGIYLISIIQLINYWHKEFILNDTLRYGIILGYEDVNDHDKLRYDPAALALLVTNTPILII